MKKRGWQRPKQYEDILLPKNTSVGIYIAGFAFLFGFAVVWHILWLALLGLGGAIACIIRLSFDENTEYVLTAKEVAKIETSKVQG